MYVALRKKFLKNIWIELLNQSVLLNIKESRMLNKYWTFKVVSTVLLVEKWKQTLDTNKHNEAKYKQCAASSFILITKSEI